MSELIERLQRAPEPDRALDREIARVLGLEVQVIHVPTGHPVFKEGGGLEFMRGPDGKMTAIPPWTASIDAALTLVPEWHKWSIACGRLVQYVARVSPVKGTWGCSDGECDSTPAIALCIAALKARIASLPSTES